MSNSDSCHENMDRRDFLSLGGVAALSAVAGNFSAPAVGAATPPNVLLIITDQHHIDAMSAAGCEHISTPALDQLAENGTRFVHSQSANPLCSPARSAIMSGRTSSEAGVYENGRPIRNEIPNIGQWLRSQADYDTVYAGKWHLPRGYTHFIPGFETIAAGIGGQGNIGDSAVSRACEAFFRHRRTSSVPFMLVASFLQPHDICEWLRLNSRQMEELPHEQLSGELPPLPDNFRYDGLEPQRVSSRRAGNEGVSNDWKPWHWRYYLWSYYRHVEMVDAEIGCVLQALHASGHADNTLVIFTADHGEGTAHHQMTRKNILYQEALAVPLIISYPGSLPAGNVDDRNVVSGLDIVPTICDFTGIDPPPNMRGRSLRRVLNRQTKTWRPFVVSDVNKNSGRAVRTRRYKYIKYAGDPVEQLFDMQKDPGETENLADDANYTDALREHRRMLAEWEGRLEPAKNIPLRDAWSDA